MIKILMLIAFCFAAFLAINTLYKIVTNFQPSRNKLNTDIAEMRAEIENYLEELITWNQEEMEIFSFNQLNQVIKKNVVTTAKGIFTSIYQEPMLAYSYKKYVSPNLNAVLYARTSLHEFVFRIRNNSTIITVDGKAIGELRDDGKLMSMNGQKLLASISKEDDLLLPVLINNKEVVSLVNPNKSDRINPRAFSMLADDLSEDDENLLLSIAVFELVNRSMV